MKNLNKIYCFVKTKLFLFIIFAGLFLSHGICTASGIWVGETVKCDASSSVMGLTSDVSWECNGGYLSLSGSGFYRNVTATQYWSGTATVICRWKYRLYYGDSWKSQTRTWSFTCNENPVSISPTSMKLTVGQTGYVKYSHKFSNSYLSAAHARFSSNNSAVATVDNTGLVTAVSEGTAYITVYSKVSDASNAPSCIITVKKAEPTGISLQSSLKLIVGETETLTPTVYPSGAKYTLTWTSSDTNIATVSSSGDVTAKKAGSACITAKINGYNYSADCYVTVEKPTLTLQANPIGGTIAQGSSVTLTASNNKAEIYYTLNGSTPNQNSTRYTSPIAIRKDLTLKAIAFHNDYKASNILTENYKVYKPKLTIEANPAGGTIAKGSTVTLTASNSKAEIHYTLDGSTPNQNSTRYSSPIVINKNSTLKAIAFHDDSKTSDILTAYYKVTSLKITSTVPENNATNIGFNIIPSVSFSSEIQPSELYSRITLLKDETEKVSGELIITKNTIYFVPDEELRIGKYSLVLPENCLKSSTSDINFAYEYSFSIRLTDLVKKIGDHKMLKGNGELHFWGNNSDLIFPDPSMDNKILSPIFVYNNIIDYQRSSQNTYILKSDGTLMGWGGNCEYKSSKSSAENSCHVLGDGTKSTRETPVEILSNVKKYCNGDYHRGAIKNDNTLWKWGRNLYGQIGNGITDESGQLAPVKVLDNVKDASFGYEHSVALKFDGSMWVWGLKDCIGTSTNQYSPYKKMTDVATISAGTDHVLVLKNDGTVWAFGDNKFGQLGDGTTTNTTTPFKVLTNVKYIEANQYQNIAIKEDGSLWRWGFIGSGNQWLIPEKILDDVVYAHANGENCFALKKDKTLWGMGSNSYGIMLENEKTEFYTTMIQLFDNVVQFWFDTWNGDGIYAMTSNGDLWGWGTNYVGNGQDKVPSTPMIILDGPYPSSLTKIDISVDTDKATNLHVGEKLVFQSVLTSPDCNYYSITWSVDDENIATISPRGVALAKKPGKTNVRLKVKAGFKCLECTHELIVTDSSGIIDIQESHMKLSTKNKVLYLENLKGNEHISVYSVLGTCIYKDVANNCTKTIQLSQKGWYIVKVESQTFKVYID